VPGLQTARVSHLGHPGRPAGGPAVNIKQEQGEPGLPETPCSPQADFTYADTTSFGRTPPLGGEVVDADHFPVEQLSNMVANSIFEAHQRTCLFSSDQIQERWSAGVDQAMVHQFSNMVGFISVRLDYTRTCFSPAKTCGLKPPKS
jgi:hypothetical protein